MDEYPEYHDLSYTVNKDGPAKAELVKRYGTWSEAVAEARRHGVKLRQAEGVRDGNPAEVYESIVNDTRAMGGTKEGAAALFRGAAQAAGVDGAASMESTEWLDVLMNVHDAIKPRMMSRFADAAEYEDAKVELADRMLGDILNVPEMTDAQAIFDGFQCWQRQVRPLPWARRTRSRRWKDLRKVQKEQNREFNRRMYENSRNGSRDEALRQWTEQQKRNEKAEKLLDRESGYAGAGHHQLRRHGRKAGRAEGSLRTGVEGRKEAAEGRTPADAGRDPAGKQTVEAGELEPFAPGGRRTAPG